MSAAAQLALPLQREYGRELPTTQKQMRFTTKTQRKKRKTELNRQDAKNAKFNIECFSEQVKRGGAKEKKFNIAIILAQKFLFDRSSFQTFEGAKAAAAELLPCNFMRRHFCGHQRKLEWSKAIPTRKQNAKIEKCRLLNPTTGVSNFGNDYGCRNGLHCG